MGSGVNAPEQLKKWMIESRCRGKMTLEVQGFCFSSSCVHVQAMDEFGAGLGSEMCIDKREEKLAASSPWLMIQKAIKINQFFHCQIIFIICVMFI